MMGAKLIMVSMPSDDPDAVQDFYADVLEYDFAPSLSHEPSWHANASVDGIDLLIGQQHQGELPMAHFAVDDLSEAVARATALNGQVVWEGALEMAPEALDDYRKLHQRERGPGTVTNVAGRAAIVRDPQGGFVGLVELEEHTHEHFKVGRFAKQSTEKDLRTHREAIRIGKKLKQRIHP